MATQLFNFHHPHPSFSSSSPSSQKRKRSYSSSSSSPTPSDISGRTLKRTRARPNEELVHQYTLQKLFSAAKATPPAPKQQQSFRRSPVLALRCEDCDREVEEEEEVRCVGCCRVVCDMGCAASNGVGRVCLECVRYQ